MEPLLADLVEAHAEAARTIASVGADQWGLPTPCEDWDVAALVRHQIVGFRVFEALLLGRTVERPKDMQAWDAELRQRDPAELPTAYVEAARDMERAFDRPGALQQTIPLPIGDLTGEAALHLRLAEVLVHGWDLARATGQQPHFPDDLVEREIGASRALLPPPDAQRQPFGTPVEVADDAPALERLAGLLGRDPS